MTASAGEGSTTGSGVGAGAGCAAWIGGTTAAAGSDRRVPQRLQKRVPGAQRLPQLGQIMASAVTGTAIVRAGIRVPQQLQKAALTETSALQFGQRAMPRRTLI